MTDPRPFASAERQSASPADAQGRPGDQRAGGDRAKQGRTADGHAEQGQGRPGGERADERARDRRPPEDRAQEDASLRGLHLVTLTHEGRFWDAFVEFVDDPGRPDSHRARLCFVPTDRADHEVPARTAVIIIESSVDEVLAQARSLNQHQVAAMLRSAI